MNFTVGENIEAVDQLGVWAVAKVIEKREASVVVTFPPWKHKWDREIVDPSEVRSKTQEDVLVPRRFANKLKSPNLKKLMTGDELCLDGKDVRVHWSDPIRKAVTLMLNDGTMQTVNVWEVETVSARKEEKQQPTRKRKRKSSDVTESQIPLQQSEAQSLEHACTESSTLEFCFYVDPTGNVISIGSFYTLSFSGNSIFVCTSISRQGHQYTFNFVLCSVVNDKVDNFLPDVSCVLRDPKQVLRSNVSCNSRVRILVDNVICEGWERVLSCQKGNIGNVSYLLDLRKSCLARQMRQGVMSGISRSATRPAQPVHLGIFDPVLDTQIFGLSSKNQFQVVYKGKDVAKLDNLLGALWDVKTLEPGNPQSHFKYVCQIRLYVHKSSMSLRFNFQYSESNIPFTATYRSSCMY